jgi:hypothetical protein
LLLLRRAHLGSWRQEFILHFSFRRYRLHLFKHRSESSITVNTDDGNDLETRQLPMSLCTRPYQACTLCPLWAWCPHRSNTASYLAVCPLLAVSSAGISMRQALALAWASGIPTQSSTPTCQRVR